MKPFMNLWICLTLLIIISARGSTNALPVPQDLQDEPKFTLDSCDSIIRNRSTNGGSVTEDNNNHRTSSSSKLCLSREPASSEKKPSPDEYNDEYHERNLIICQIVLTCLFVFLILTIISMLVLDHFPPHWKNYVTMVERIKREEKSIFDFYRKAIFSSKLLRVLGFMLLSIPAAIPIYLIGVVIRCTIYLWKMMTRFRRMTKVEVEGVKKKVVTRRHIDSYKFDILKLDDASKVFTLPNTGHYSFQTYKILKQEHNEMLRGQDACPICLENYKDFDYLVTLPCGHIYHYICLDDLLRSNAKSDTTMRCPTCNLNLIRHHLYFKKHRLNQSKVGFDNKQ